MRIRTVVILVGSFSLFACEGQAPETAAPEPEAAAAPSQPAAPTRTPSPGGAMVYFVAPSDGAQVTSPITVAFGLQGAGVAPAGVELPNTGHHHLLVDTELSNESLPIPADEQHIHFGLGQTETTIELAPGRHTLQLLLGDWKHVPHNPPVVSERITITVR